jgi:hypothetical protein
MNSNSDNLLLSKLYILVEEILKSKVFDKICNFTVSINLFDAKLILQQGKCRLPPSTRVINSAEESAEKNIPMIPWITLPMPTKKWQLQ